MNQTTPQNIKHTAHLNHLLLENTSFSPVLGTLSRTSLSSAGPKISQTGDWNTERIKDLRTRTLTCFKYPCKAYCSHHSSSTQLTENKTLNSSGPAVLCSRELCKKKPWPGCALRNRACNNACGYCSVNKTHQCNSLCVDSEPKS